jgi:hypothetical protein
MDGKRRKKDSATFVLISRTNFTRNFVRVFSATVRDFSAVTMQLNPGKGLKTNKRDSGILVQRDRRTKYKILNVKFEELGR